MTEETPRQTYLRLLYEAHSASVAVDNFDLHSERPESVAAWKQLLLEAESANTQLIQLVKTHSLLALIDPDPSEAL